MPLIRDTTNRAAFNRITEAAGLQVEKSWKRDRQADISLLDRPASPAVEMSASRVSRSFFMSRSIWQAQNLAMMSLE